MKLLADITRFTVCFGLMSSLAFADTTNTLSLTTQPIDTNNYILQLEPLQTKNETVAIEEGKDVQYAIFRSDGDVYLKGRAGYLTDYTKQSFEDISIEEIVGNFNDNGALGIGAGYTFKNGNKLEFEYTVTKRAEQILQIEYLF